LTFKLPSGHGLAEDFDPRCVFARAWGFSLGKPIKGELPERAAAVVAAGSQGDFDVLHVWQRDMARPGFRGFDPHVTAEAQAACAAILEAWSRASQPPPATGPAPLGKRVLDCMLIEPDQWFLGYHRAAGEMCFPGGLRPIALPEDSVSRAYLKMEEALAWSGLPIQPGQTIAEIGCAPGGASQALLAHGLKVMGIDPAQVDPRVLAHPNFVHVRKRGADVRRREFRGVAWLTADMNVAPQYTLDTLEAIVTHSDVKVRGMLVTLKLLDWELAEHVNEYLDRIRSWGYKHVRARQLAHNRQELCVAAMRSRGRK
jgi:23S rRNA (cytidine2498-2'-O)-methyltransferase